jgi:CRP-like cAMP-binding protein
VDGIVINTLSSGQVFGELALILKSKRSASIKATSNCNFLVMKPLTFKQTL